MPPKSEPLNAWDAQEFHRYTIEQEAKGRKIWESKYGEDYCEKWSETHRVAAETREKFGMQPAVRTQNVELFNAKTLPKEMQKAVHYELENDVTGIWADTNIDADLFPVDKHSKRTFRFD
ncbi:hypothetical protein SS50377_27648 [Spironucleus salmonicida]|uniref:Uncharacterized protein n=1 Tax=Spironucleus salmonicida TaxID=348837 RepID=V6M0B3_9EUKA|nr:hypothetical protein SS50377_27648 [Spironucleus salmonicida]|eukprot:EST46574.1 hypothetical protein SS50377_13378 [Spironucleus salmonicida]